jgi:CDP-diacylglycerol--glycerol-3-phosphate 3-phosphatidyltransferase
MLWLKKHLPNLLSILRVLLMIPFFLAISREDMATLSLVSGTIILTDFLDGRLARAWNTVSDAGKVLDPLADKICAALAAVSLVYYRDFPPWLLLVVILRDLIILIAGLVMMSARKPIPVSNAVGRATMTALAVTFVIYILDLELLKLPVILAIIILMSASLVSYGRQFLSALGPNPAREP